MATTITESFSWGPIIATTDPVTVRGGCYVWNVIATWGSGGTVKVQMLGADGSTYVSCYDNANVEASATANRSDIVMLTPGQVKIVVSGTITGGYVNLARVPT